MQHEFNEKESLELITRMIRNTQDQLSRHGGKPFLVWGYSTLLVALSVWTIFTLTANPAWMWLWFAILPLGGLGSLCFGRRSPNRFVKTFVDRVIGSVWLVLGICLALVPLFQGFLNISIPTLFVEALLINIGVAITGRVIRLRYIQVAGFIGILIVFAIPLLPDMSDQILLFAAMALVTMVVPGHIMTHRSSVEKHDSESNCLLKEINNNV